MKSKQRVFWTEQEREAVAAAGRDLRSKHPRLTIDQLLGKAQLVLPKSRRRPINANLNAWLSKELKTGAVKPARARRHIPAQVATTSAQRSKASSVSRALIDAGVALLTRILSHPSVQRGLRSALIPAPARKIRRTKK